MKTSQSEYLKKRIVDMYPMNNTGFDPDVLGVELEMESPNTSISIHPEHALFPAGWSSKKETSLKGYGIEWVLSTPLSREAAINSVLALYDSLAKNKAVISDSMRAGVHIHLNFQKATIKEIATFLAAYYCLEIALVKLLPVQRQGNLFCLRLVDAEAIQNYLISWVTGEKHPHEDLKYGAMNLYALRVFGTLEFRAIKTTPTPYEVIKWINILSDLKYNAKKFNSPVEIFDLFSATSAVEVATTLLGPSAEYITKTPTLEEDMITSLRAAQFWVYSTNWETN